MENKCSNRKCGSKNTIQTEETYDCFYINRQYICDDCGTSFIVKIVKKLTKEPVIYLTVADFEFMDRAFGL